MSDTGFYTIDSLILGCTHYPLIKNEISDYFEQHFTSPVSIIDSSIAVAESLKTHLESRNLLAPHGPPPKNRFFVSDYSQRFEDSAKLFLRRAVTFEKVLLE